MHRGYMGLIFIKSSLLSSPQLAVSHLLNIFERCVCYSSWEVGRGSGQTQQSEYFGFDCSLRTICFLLYCIVLYCIVLYCIVLYCILFYTKAARQKNIWVRLGRCPSGEDPITTVNETDCEGINGGEKGNLCHVDCSNRYL